MTDPFDQTDAVLARKLTEIVPPADLRARLLATAPVPAVESPATSWWSRRVTAIAAALVIGVAVLGLWTRPWGGDSMAGATADLSAFLTEGFSLDLKTPDVSKVRGWLAQATPGRQITLPDALAANPTIGCREINWRSHQGWLACFSLGGGREAHLAMFPTGTFSDEPGSTPKIAAAGKWNRATWSKNGMTYLLFVPAGMDPMKELVGAVSRHASGKIASSSAMSMAPARANDSSARARIVSPV